VTASFGFDYSRPSEPGQQLSGIESSSTMVTTSATSTVTTTWLDIEVAKQNKIEKHVKNVN